MATTRRETSCRRSRCWSSVSASAGPSSGKPSRRCGRTGWSSSRHGVGVFVLGPRQTSGKLELFTQATDKISDIIEELELRIGIEVEAAGLAALRSSPAQEAEIQSQLEIFGATGRQRACRPTRPISISTWRSRQATNNGRFKSFLEHIGRRIIPRVKFRSAMGGIDPLPNRDRILLAEHTEVAEAIWARDPEQAREAMRRHLLGGIKRYRALTRPKPPQIATDNA